MAVGVVILGLTASMMAGGVALGAKFVAKR
jgi:hypothetical protein